MECVSEKFADDKRFNQIDDSSTLTFEGNKNATKTS